jgi:hypothetical protein
MFEADNSLSARLQVQPKTETEDAQFVEASVVYLSD